MKTHAYETDPPNDTNPPKILALRRSQRPLRGPLPKQSADPRPTHPTEGKAVTVQITPLMVDVKTAALLLNMSRTVVFDEIRRGRLRTVKRGASRLVPIKSLHEYVDLLLNEAQEMEAA